MSKNITLNINNAKSTVESIQLKTGQGAPVRIPARANVNYQMIEEATQVGPENIMTKRAGQNLEIAFEGSSIENPDLIIENYYAADGKIGYSDGDSNLLIGEHENGNLYPYVPESAIQEDAVSMLAEEVQAGQALGGEAISEAFWMPNPLWLLALLPLAAIAAAGGSSGGENKPALTIIVDAPDNTADTTPLISGETNASGGSVVTVTITDSKGAIQVVSTIVSELGEFTVEPTIPLAPGDYTAEATVVDKKDPTKTVTATDPGSIIGVTVDAPDDTNDNTPTITGTVTDALPGAVVTIVITDSEGKTQTVSTMVSEDGTYSVDVPNALPEGPYIADATVTDKDGNDAKATDPGSIDTTAPQITVDAPDNSSDTTPTITGTTDAPAGSVVTIVVTDKDGATQTVTTIVKDDGSYEVDVPNALPEGPYEVEASVKDPAGNEGKATDPGSIDTTAPSVVAEDQTVVEASGATVTGTIKVNDANGIASITVAGKEVTAATVDKPIVITTENGTLTVTGYDQTKGEISYSYTENGQSKDHTAGDDSIKDSFVVSVKDTAGNTGLEFVDISIQDTAPVAVDDVNSIKETGKSVDGNVLLNDTTGADTPITVSSGTTTGSYGQLVLNADGTYTYTLNGDNDAVKDLSKGQTLTDSFSYTITDSDGDSSTANLNITINGVDDKLVIGGNGTDTCLRGGDGNDVIIGDKGGAETILTPGKDYNVAIMLDVSNSMLDYKTDDGTRYLEMARSSLLKLANDLGNHDGEINVTFMTFNKTSTIRLNIADLDESNVDQLMQNIQNLNVVRGNQGSTNYDEAFQTASKWFASASGNGYENITYFLTDGEPTAYGSTGTGGTGAWTTQAVIDASLKSFTGLSNISAVHAFGFGKGVGETSLNYFDNTSDNGVNQTVDVIREYDGKDYRDVVLKGKSGESAIIHTPDELDAALVGGTSETHLYQVSDDNIQGGAGDDIIFGDSINTDGLSWVENGVNYDAGSHDGMGSAALSRFVQWSENNGSEATTDQINSYVRENWQDLLDGRPDGGNDVIRGGEGDDIIFGGAGNDVMFGNEGSDQFVFLANSNSGKDQIMDFEMGEDKVVFADLVSADQLTGAAWNDANHTLSFKGVGSEGQTYNNSITFTGLASGETLESILQDHTQFIG